MLALAWSAAALSLKPSHSFAILVLRLTSVTSLAIFFYFLCAGAGVAIWTEGSSSDIIALDSS
jgi:hypothetical protein